ncbi:glycoside hydrolase family 140 protein [Pedobacter duraquae]|uniref:Collagenase-like protein with putative collagen-binding domain n=1 Tax=Pedobacter duraquae TaxID=425511 RepID=A0A4R6IMB2_9SPHI|nr:glycoside hydrolase family 140 protein [Pedobacter duraquae]TDO23283.1 collagenase-like protein with putative collagen-binding domain [Pedobacter duraquae]
MNRQHFKSALSLVFAITTITRLVSPISAQAQTVLAPIKISENQRYFMAKGKPFFWLGDTGWLLLSKLKREQAEQYLENRHKLGFNVIQVMVVHDNKEINAYGDSALVNKKINTPHVTSGSTFGKGDEYDYWDHMDWIIKLAASKGMYMALVPVWGSVIKATKVNATDGAAYAEFLAKRFRDNSNIIWLNGGDIRGSDFTDTWEAIGNALRKNDPDHLITFHPFGRTQSSKWFHDSSWLDFNSFQSGHRTYAQDTDKKDLNYGEDNWRYVQADYAKTPVKPTLDAEPSYENIPYGLHDVKLPKWNAADLRRYAYWSVFAGAAGFTYGDNDVMQFHLPTDKSSAYGSTTYWEQGIEAPGAQQMRYLKKLIESHPYFERVPDQSLIASGQGEKYDRLLATRGKKYAYIYTYTGRVMLIDASKLDGKMIKANWVNPRTGLVTTIGVFPKGKSMKFNPPGAQKNGNDWVLLLDAI